MIDVNPPSVSAPISFIRASGADKKTSWENNIIIYLCEAFYLVKGFIRDREQEV